MKKIILPLIAFFMLTVKAPALATEEKDGRPEYFKPPLGHPLPATAFAFWARLEQKDPSYSFDLAAQRADLNNYYENTLRSLDTNLDTNHDDATDALRKIELNDQRIELLKQEQEQLNEQYQLYLKGFSMGKYHNEYNTTLFIYSKATPYNPPVIFYLHGSSGVQELSHDSLLVQHLMDKGFAVITFPRFDDTWDNQVELPLSHEIMMVHSVLRFLVDSGSTEFHIMGHSRGGTLALACAEEFNAKRFREVKGKMGHRGYVRSYIALAPMPVHMTGTLTQKEPIYILQGKFDTVCPVFLMKYYYENKLKMSHRNVTYSEVNCGHTLFPDYPLVTLSKSFQWFKRDIGYTQCYLSRGDFLGASCYLFQSIKEFSANLKSLLFSEEGKEIVENFPTAQNFHQSTALIDYENETFSPLSLSSKEEIKVCSPKLFQEYGDFMKKSIELGVTSKEIIESEKTVIDRASEVSSWIKSISHPAHPMPYSSICRIPTLLTISTFLAVSKARTKRTNLYSHFILGGIVKPHPS